MKKLREAIKNTKQLATEENVYNDFELPSFEKDWNVENCAEIWSVRKAIMNGAKWENLSFMCVDIKTNTYKLPCSNCQITFAELLD